MGRLRASSRSGDLGRGSGLRAQGSRRYSPRLVATWREPKRLGAIGAVVAIVVVAALVLASRGGGGSGTCSLDADAVTVLAEGMIRNDDANRIARASEVGTFDEGACADLVAAMVDRPGDDVTFEIAGQPVTMRGAELTAVEISGPPTCDSWLSDTLQSLCTAGSIDPPPALFGI